MDEMQEEQKNLFERLKEIRLSKGILLDEIAKKTRIHLRYLEAFESSELDKVPGIYDKLFFKTYVEYLECENENEIFEEFRKLRKEEEPQHTTTIRKIQSSPLDPGKSQLQKGLFIGIPLIVVAIIIIVLAINSTGIDSSVVTEDVKELTVQEIVDEMKTEELPANVPDSIVSMEQNVAVNVGLEAIEETWVRIIKDHSDTTEFLLQGNEKLNLQADSVLSFLIGNGAGLSFMINGELAGVLGKRGEVITYLKITPKGIEDKQVKKIQPKDVTRDSLANI